jgi:hypothetical protein
MSFSVPLTSFFNDVKIQYHWASWNTHHIKLTFVTQTNKLSSFLLIFELFSLIFYWKYSIFLHETPIHEIWRDKYFDVTCIVGKARVIFHEWYKFLCLFARFAALHSRKDIQFLSLVADPPTNKLSSFLLIFELFSLIFYWKYSIFLHETPIHEIWRDKYFDVIEEWRQRYGKGHLEIRKNSVFRKWPFSGWDELTCTRLYSLWHPIRTPLPKKKIV